MQTKFRIVNKTAIGKNTQIFIIKEDGTEQNISGHFLDCTIAFDRNGLVTATLVARIDEIDIVAFGDLSNGR